MFKVIQKIIAMVALVILASGCAVMNPGNSPVYYRGNENLTAQQVYLGTVLAVKPITISAAEQGNAVGGVAGGGTGALIGGLAGGKLGAIIGGVGGLVIGSIVGGNVDHSNGVLVTVRMENNGKIFAIPEADSYKFTVGEEVQVSQFQGNNGKNVVRVIPMS